MTVTDPLTKELGQPRPTPDLATPLNLWVITLCCVASTIGLAGDIGRHLRSGTSLTGDFFASWHLVLYGGVTGAAAWLGHLALTHGPKAMRDTFGPTTYGVFVLGIGGASDFAWHSRFGIEVDIAALVSPPHLTILLGLVLMSVGPVNALWRAGAPKLSWCAAGIVATCTTCIVVIVMLFTGYLSVFSSGIVVNGWLNPMIGSTTDPTDEILAIATLVWSSLVFALPWALLSLRWRLRPGMIAATFVVIAASSSVAVQGRAGAVVTAILYGGIALDVVVSVLLRWLTGERAAVVIGALTPPVLWVTLFRQLDAGGQMVWGPAMWVGAIALSSMVTAGVAAMLALVGRSRNGSPGSAGSQL